MVNIRVRVKGDRVRFDGREVGWGNLVEVWVGVGGAWGAGRRLPRGRGRGAHNLLVPPHRVVLLEALVLHPEARDQAPARHVHSLKVENVHT